MKRTFLLIAIPIVSLLLSCNTKTANQENKPNAIIGTWKLISGTLIEKGDTTVTWYTKNLSFIKIINNTHFAFLKHDLSKGKDSSAAYDSGGGRYELDNNNYTEHLEYCNEREWEAHDFKFTIEFRNDTLIQSGLEKIDSIGVNRLNTEKYVRLAN